jgi:GNAT superfamily N-acetyltransferase
VGAAAVAITQATASEVALVAGVLGEAARFLEARGEPMWRLDELSEARLREPVTSGEFFVARVAGEAAGVVRVQADDALIWPDARATEALYVHRLAVRRAFADAGVSQALLSFAAERARTLGRAWLRLDCEAQRPKLRAVYERFGFAHHSDFRVGPRWVARYELRV